jgi:hypothetical protein
VSRIFGKVNGKPSYCRNEFIALGEVHIGGNPVRNAYKKPN